MGESNGKRQKIRYVLMANLLVAGAAIATPAFADTAPAQAPIASTGSCGNIQQAINTAAQNIQNQADNTYQSVPPPANLASSTCFSNILNMGSNIGLSFFNPSTLIQQLSQMACNAAQQALQWPMQQADSAINNDAQLPYGMGGITAGQGSNGISVNTFTSSGPAVGNLSTGGSSTLSNALGG
ncbi:hypothetical protein [Acidithiobacillus sulfurivorans]|uniref:Uncharacterized protein n=1 Tax=Acidithiobacillus sulfurivorans TaxID=1958756 RepID=A0ABS6A1G1_9PROT|nr:hypothetical protein [Acidithiobacillus sulfurivorans]MBU2761105.1 hypothetical protein [Acidithiobacillus sulfurivorans]